MTPYEAWTDNKPNVRHLREFGGRVLCLNNDPTKGKLTSRSKAGIFLGYSDQSKGYRIWIPEEQRVVISRDVKFLDDKTNETESSISVPETSSEEKTAKPELEIDLMTSKEDTSNQNIAPEDIDPRETSSEEGHFPMITDEEAVEIELTTPKRGPGRPKMLRTGQRGRSRKLFQPPRESAKTVEEHYVFLSEVPLREATSGPHAEEWMEAMASEVKSIIRNDTWEIVPHPTDRHIIGSRIVLTNKFRPDSSIERRKARIVAQGFSQYQGVHFNQTFAPVARMSTIRLIVAVAVCCGMNIQQLDVTTAYLNGTIDAEIFISPPKMLQDCLKFR